MHSFKMIVPKKRHDRYYMRDMKYKTGKGGYPLKTALRQALYDYSEYYGEKHIGKHLHHVLIPCESIIEVFLEQYNGELEVAYINRTYTLHEWYAREFARYHDDVLKSHEGAGIAILEPEEHRAIHSQMRIDGVEQRDIKHWTEVLRDERRSII